MRLNSLSNRYPAVLGAIEQLSVDVPEEIASGM